MHNRVSSADITYFIESSINVFLMYMASEEEWDSTGLVCYDTRLFFAVLFCYTAATLNRKRLLAPWSFTR
jgi:hypothetical protein